MPHEFHHLFWFSWICVQTVLPCFENCVFFKKVKILNNADVNFLPGVPRKVVTLYLVHLVADPSFASYCCVPGGSVKFVWNHSRRLKNTQYFKKIVTQKQVHNGNRYVCQMFNYDGRINILMYPETARAFTGRITGSFVNEKIVFCNGYAVLPKGVSLSPSESVCCRLPWGPGAFPCCLAGVALALELFCDLGTCCDVANWTLKFFSKLFNIRYLKMFWYVNYKRWQSIKNVCTPSLSSPFQGGTTSVSAPLGALPWLELLLPRQESLSGAFSWSSCFHVVLKNYIWVYYLVINFKNDFNAIYVSCCHLLFSLKIMFLIDPLWWW